MGNLEVSAHLQRELLSRWAAKVELVRRECIRIAGGQYRGELQRDGALYMVFGDPTTGATIAMEAVEIVSVESVQQRLRESRAIEAQN